MGENPTIWKHGANGNRDLSDKLVLNLRFSLSLSNATHRTRQSAFLTFTFATRHTPPISLHGQ